LVAASFAAPVSVVCPGAVTTGAACDPFVVAVSTPRVGATEAMLSRLACVAVATAGVELSCAEMACVTFGVVASGVVRFGVVAVVTPPGVAVATAGVEPACVEPA
jgi:hypothetical protein